MTKPATFDDHADGYDARRAPFAPMTAALHLLSAMVLHELGPSARILCVGAGTGAELLALAEAFPGWRFTAVDPSAKMLAVCERAAAEAGIVDRCAFHVGTLDTLPPGEPFDGATSILVSQFLLDLDARLAFFVEIASRLRPGGLLISADLATGTSGEAFERMLDVWFPAMHRVGLPADRSAFGRGVAVLSPGEIERLIVSAGFAAPTLFHQALLIHGWYTRLGPERQSRQRARKPTVGRGRG